MMQVTATILLAGILIGSTMTGVIIQPTNTQDDTIIINEIMYDPAGADQGREWLEIYNADTNTINISGWKLNENSVDHTLTLIQGTTTIPTQGYAIISDDSDDFLTDYPTYTGTLFDSSFSLTNIGEYIAIKDTNGTIIDDITYNPLSGANGTGHTIELGYTGGWFTSLENGGTPGTINTLATTPMTITKTIWNGQQWVNSINANINDPIKFKITIENTGTNNYQLYDFTIIDFIPMILTYNNNAKLNGTAREPDVIDQQTITWNLIYPELIIYQGQSASIEFDTIATELGTADNLCNISATYCGTMTVYGEDTAAVTITETMNNPPYEPSEPNPEDRATNVSVFTDLSWTGEDPDGDPVTYDVYFGTTNPPPLIEQNHTETNYDLNMLSSLTSYFWKIVAWDDQGASTQGKVWQFTTEEYTNLPPYEPTCLEPLNGSTNVSIQTNLRWVGGDPDENDTTTYDVYFGTNTTPDLVENNQSGVLYDPNILAHNTTYYWRIVSWDNHGAFTEGDLWEFTTEPGADFSVVITKPAEGSIYFRDSELMGGRSSTIVCGPITILAEVTGDVEISKVEFYVNDALIGFDDEAPYEYAWDKILSKKYIIKVIAFDSEGNTAEDTVEIFKWRLHPVLLLAGAAILLKAATGMVTGWTIIRGYVFNMHSEGKYIVFRAVRLHYTRLTILGREKGVIKLEKCRIREPNIKFQYNLGPFGKLQYISGVCRGGFKEPVVGFNPLQFMNRLLPLLTE